MQVIPLVRNPKEKKKKKRRKQRKKGKEKRKETQRNTGKQNRIIEQICFVLLFLDHFLALDSFVSIQIQLVV